MAEFNAVATSHARPNIDEVVELMRPQLEELQRQLDHFRAQPITPTAFFDLEIHLQGGLRESGRSLLQKGLSEFEPATREEAPLRVNFERETYRRRPKQPKTIYSTFRTPEYTRFRYEACE